MPELDPLLLSRIQFAFTISFHILFPSFTIGLAAWLLVLEILWLKTGKRIYADIMRHWTKIFAVSFGMAWCPELCCPTSSAPIGASSRGSAAMSSDR